MDGRAGFASDVPLKRPLEAWDHNAPLTTKAKDGWLHHSGAARPELQNQKPWTISRKVVGGSATIMSKMRRYLTVAAHQTEGEIYEQQPSRIALPRAESIATRPSTTYSTKSFSTFVTGGWDTASRVTTRVSTSYWRPKTAESQARPIISAPSNFRRVDSAAIPRRRRAEFRPLELSIYLPHNRLSPLPDFSKSDWTAKLDNLELPRPAVVRAAADSDFSFATPASLQRKPVDSASFLFSPSVPGSHRSSSIYDTIPYGAPSILPTPPPAVPSRSHANILVRSVTQRSNSSTSESMTRPKSPSSLRSRASSEPLNTRVRRSNQSRGNLSDIDDAIHELNTIVEERRVDKHVTSDRDATAPVEDDGAGGDSPTHIPAIAPSMKMRVRSETLSDIGSALSVPHTSRTLPSPSLPGLGPHSRHISDSSLTTADLFDEPLGSPLSRSSTRTRLTNWIRTSLPFSPTSASMPTQLDLQSPTIFPFAAELPPTTPPYFQMSYKNTNVHPLYSCPATTPPCGSVSTVTTSPHSSIQSSPSKTVRTRATSITEIDFDPNGKKSFEAGRSISSALETDKVLINSKTNGGVAEWKEIEALAGRRVDVGVAY